MILSLNREKVFCNCPRRSSRHWCHESSEALMHERLTVTVYAIMIQGSRLTLLVHSQRNWFAVGGTHRKNIEDNVDSNNNTQKTSRALGMEVYAKYKSAGALRYKCTRERKIQCQFADVQMYNFVQRTHPKCTLKHVNSPRGKRRHLMSFTSWNADLRVRRSWQSSGPAHFHSIHI